MQFPRFVFTSPGPLVCNGGTYGQELVEDEANLQAALAAGFFATLPEALAAKDKPKEAPKAEAPKAEPAAEPKEPALTKAELVAQAEALGVKVDARWGEAKLAEAIAKAGA